MAAVNPGGGIGPGLYDRFAARYTPPDVDAVSPVPMGSFLGLAATCGWPVAALVAPGDPGALVPVPRGDEAPRGDRAALGGVPRRHCRAARRLRAASRRPDAGEVAAADPRTRRGRRGAGGRLVHVVRRHRGRVAASAVGWVKTDRGPPGRGPHRRHGTVRCDFLGSSATGPDVLAAGGPGAEPRPPARPRRRGRRASPAGCCRSLAAVALLAGLPRDVFTPAYVSASALRLARARMVPYADKLAAIDAAPPALRATPRADAVQVRATASCCRAGAGGEGQPARPGAAARDVRVVAQDVGAGRRPTSRPSRPSSPPASPRNSTPSPRPACWPRSRPASGSPR